MEKEDDEGRLERRIAAPWDKDYGEAEGGGGRQRGPGPLQGLELSCSNHSSLAGAGPKASGQAKEDFCWTEFSSGLNLYKMESMRVKARLFNQ